MSSSSLPLRLQKLEPWFYQFLLATLLPLFVMPFTNLDGNLIQRVLLPLSTLWMVLVLVRIVPTDLLFIGRWKPFGLYRPLALLCAVLMWLPSALGHHHAVVFHWPVLLMMCSFYLFTAVGIVLMLGKVGRVNEPVLCLGAAGYIHLGLTGGQLATALEVLQPGTFSLGLMLPGEELVERLSYFSFVTLGTQGYGDVLPSTATAESFVVLLSVSATLYVTLMIGLLVSRYLQTRESRV